MELSDVYRAYIACLNRRDWPMLGHFVNDDVIYNDKEIGLSGYIAHLKTDVATIPDLSFKIQLLVAEASYVASRLEFRCSPAGAFLGLRLEGKTVSFTENVFYRFRDEKIERVWSVIDKAAIEAQLSTSPAPSQPGPG